MKKFLTLILVSALFLPVHAQKSELLKLPFDMVLGVTSSEQIANYGQCIKNQVKDDPNSKCLSYQINEGFMADVSDRDKIIKLTFNVRYLPKNWKNLGFVNGLNKTEFTSLIRTLNAKDITNFGVGEKSMEIDFVIEEYLYTASFKNSYFNGIQVSLAY